MRITQVLNLKKRIPVRRQHERSYFIPFQELYPVELEDSFTSQTRNANARPCISQLTVMLQCFKDSDFNQKRCAESIKAYYSCIADHEAKKTTDGGSRKLTDVKRVRDLTQLEATKLLKTKPIK